MKQISTAELGRMPGTVMRLARQEPHLVVDEKNQPLGYIISVEEYERLRDRQAVPTEEIGEDWLAAAAEPLPPGNEHLNAELPPDWKPD